MEGDPFTAILVVIGPSNGVLELFTDGSFVYTPSPDFSGIDTFMYAISETSAGPTSNPATVTITVSPVNDAPLADDDVYSTDEDISLHVDAPGLLGNDGDVDGDSLTVSLVSGPSHGTLVFLSDGSFTYTPELNFNGPDFFTYVASDGSLDSNIATVIITVSAVNDLPVAEDDSYETQEDTQLIIDAPGVLWNDYDVDGDPFAGISVVIGPSNGVLELFADGSFVYTPSPDFYGIDTFMYVVAETGGGPTSNIATVIVTVSPVNDAPIAVEDEYSMHEDDILVIPAPGLLENDYDIDGDSFYVFDWTLPVHGSLLMNSDGSFTFTPDADWYGVVTFEYAASDIIVGNFATVTITVLPMDEPIQITSDAEFAAMAAAQGWSGDGSADYPFIIEGLHIDAADGVYIFDMSGELVSVCIWITWTQVHFIIRDCTLTGSSTSIGIYLQSVANGDLINNDFTNDYGIYAQLVSFLTIVDNNCTGGRQGITLYECDSSTVARNICNGNGEYGILLFGDHNTVSENICNYNMGFGIILTGDYAGPSTYNIINDNTCNGNGDNGITVSESDQNSIYGNTCNGNGRSGISVSYSDYNTIHDNTCSDNIYEGIELQNCQFNMVANNTCSYNNVDVLYYVPDRAGIHLRNCVDNTLFNNTVSYNGEGIYLEGGRSNIIVWNVVIENWDYQAKDTGADNVFQFNYWWGYGGPDADNNGIGDTPYYFDGNMDSYPRVSLEIVNTAPVAVDDAYTINEDDPLVVSVPGVLENDYDEHDQSLRSFLVTGPMHGTLTLLADGSFTYTPLTDWFGTDSFTYTTHDWILESNIATVTITVLPMDEPIRITSDTEFAAMAAAEGWPGDGSVDYPYIIEGLNIDAADATYTLDIDGDVFNVCIWIYGTRVHFIIRDCTLASESPSAGIFLWDVANGVLIDNNCTNDRYGILVRLSNHLTIVDNTCTGAGQGITLIACDFTIVTRNICNNNGYGIFLSGDHNTVSDNICNYNTYPGIFLESRDPETPSTFNIINNNTCNYNGYYGIAISRSDQNTIYNNTCNGNGNSGIALNLSDQNNIHDNTCNANYYEGIELYYSHSNLVANNTCNYNNIDEPYYFGKAGIYLINCEDNTLYNNTLSYNRDGISVEGGTSNIIVWNVFIENRENEASDTGVDNVFQFNYWWLHVGPDADNNGIIDTPYYFDGNMDSYPRVSVEIVNTAPVAVDDTYTINEDDPLVVSVPGILENDYDTLDQFLQSFLVAGPMHGTLTLLADGSFTYNPLPDWYGTDSFTYTTHDWVSESNIATVTITVLPMDEPIQITSDAEFAAIAAAEGWPGDGSPDYPYIIEGLNIDAADAAYTLDIDGDVFNVCIWIYGTRVHFVIRDCTLTSESPSAGIFLWDVANGVLIDNNCTNDRYGILVWLSSSLTIVDNTCTGAGQGITLLACDFTIVTRNICNNNGYGIFLSGDHNTVSDNICNYNTYPGIFLSPRDSETPSTFNIIKNNTCNYNGYYGIAVSSSDQNTIYNNTCNGNGNSGIALNHSNQNTIHDNTCNENYYAGIELQNCESNMVANNTVNGNNLFELHPPVQGSIYLRSCIDTTVYNNTCINNHGSIYLDGGTSNIIMWNVFIESLDWYDYSAIDTGTDNVFRFNYWWLHGGLDADNNGIFDTPYYFEGNMDPYPRVSPDVTVAVLDDAYITDEDNPLSILAPGILENDGTIFQRLLVVTLASGPSHGTLTLLADGSFTYTPDLNFYGDDLFVYEVSDGTFTDTATVTITVNSVNDAPVTNDDTPVTDEDTPVSIPVLANDIDPDGDALTIDSVGPALHGSVVIDAGIITYYPFPDFYGTDSFTYTVSDGNGGTATGTVTVTVTPVNDAPVADDVYVVTDEDVMVDDLFVVDDVDGDHLTIVSVESPLHGTVWYIGGLFSYTPDANYNGPDSFTYTVSDGTLTATATVFITVTPVNDAPVTNDDTPVTDEDHPVSIPVLANDIDPDGDALTIDSVGPALHGSVVIDAGIIIYSPFPDFYGTDSFTYTVSDGNGGTATGTVTVTVNSVNDAPVANAGGPYTIGEGAEVTFDASGSTDIEGDQLQFRWDIDGDGDWDTAWSTVPTVAYTLYEDYFGTVTVEVTDGEFYVAASTTLTVYNVAPTAYAGPDLWTEEGMSFAFHGLITDPGALDTHTIVWDFGDGSSVVTGTLDPTHIYVDNGVYVVTLTVTDDDGGVGTDTMTMYVNNVAPVVDAGPDQTIDEGDIVIFGGSFTDPGASDTHTFVWDFGDGSPVVTGTLSPTHVYTNPGVYLVTLTVTDDDGGIGTSSLTVIVLDITPPVTTASPDRPPDFAGWYQADVIVTLESVDSGSGVATTAYRYEGIPWTEYTGPFTFSLEGGKTIEFNSTDLAGNVEATKTLEILIDKELPVPVISLSGDLGDNDWYVSDVAVTFSIADGISGVGWCYFILYNAHGTEYILEETYYNGLDSAEFILTTSIESGELWAWMNVSDVAGNWITDELVFKIDKTAPETSMILETGDWNNNARDLFDWTNDPVTLCYDWEFSSDALSGFALIDDSVYPPLYGVMYRIDGGPWQYLNLEQIDPWLVGDPWILYPEFQGRVPLETINSEGIHTLEWYSIDMAGNTESTHEVIFGIDLTAPELEVIITGTSITDHWFSSNVIVTIEASDTLSGLVDVGDGFGFEFYYRIDGGGYQSGRLLDIDSPMSLDFSYTFTSEGVHTFEAWVCDSTGYYIPPDMTANCASNFTRFWIDMTAPETVMTLETDDWGYNGNDPFGWTNDPVTICYDWEFSSDALSGFALIDDSVYPPLYGVMYRIDGGPWQYLNLEQIDPWLVGDPWILYPEFQGRVPLQTITTEGVHILEWYSIDMAGNSETVHEVTFGIDQTPPELTVIFSGTTGTNNWYSSNVLVTAEASDALSGLVDVGDATGYVMYYRIDGGTIQEGRIIDPDLHYNLDLEFRHTFTTEGPHTVEVWICDNTGIYWPPDFEANYAYNITTIYIDKTLPSTTLSLDRVPDFNGWYSADVTVTLSAIDGESDIATTAYRYDGIPWTTYTGPFAFSLEGVTSLQFNSTDIAGNVETTKTYEIYLDKTAPEITLTPERLPDLNGWYTSAVSVTINVTDWVSGIGSGDYLLIDEAGTWQLSDFIPNGVLTFETTIPIPVDGIIYVTVPSAIDQAGNTAEIALITLNIDETPPSTEISVVGEFEFENYLFFKATVTLIPSDPLSGISESFYSLDGETWSTYSGPFDIYTEGENIVHYYSIDAVGNTESAKSYSFILDTTPPEIALDISGTVGTNGWYISVVTVTATVSDTVSGVLQASLSVVDHQGTLDYYEEVPSPGNSHVFTYTITVESGDLQIIVDVYDYAGQQDSETISISIDTTSPETTIATERVPEGVNVTLDATDATSGVADILYSIDDMVTWVQYISEFTLTGGIVDVYYYSVDVAGNSGPINMESIIVDNTPPVTVISFSEELGDLMPIDDWFFGNIIVTLTATDDFSSVVETVYSTDLTNWIVYTEPFRVTTEGETTIYFYSTDSVGNVEETKYDVAKKDTEYPAGQFGYDGILGLNDWYISDGTLTISVTDTASGLYFVDCMVYSGDFLESEVYHGDGSIKSKLFTFYIPIDGQITIEVTVQDIRWNKFENRILMIDTTAPVTIFPFLGVPHGWWYEAPVEFVFPATDGLSGVALTEYSFDLVTWYVYTDPFLFYEDGDHTIYYRSTDVAGNVEETNEYLSLKIDGTAPDCLIELTGTLGDNGWYTSDVLMNVTLTDLLSGVDYVLIKLEDQYEPLYYDFSGVAKAEILLTISGEYDNYKIDVLGFDVTNNIDQWVVRLFIDKTPPETTLTYVQVPDLGSIVTLAATDSLSGVANTMYSLDGITWLTYSTPITLSSGGLVDVLFYSVDVAGNIETTNVAPVEVDILPPVTVPELDGVLGLAGWYVSDVDVTLTATDDIMGVNLIAYSLDGIVWNDYEGPFTLSVEGLTTVYFNATDNVGNMESTQAIEIYIDKTAPTTDLVIGTPSYGFDPTYVSTTTDFALEATDTTSGVNRIEYRIDSGEWIQYMSPFTVPDIGAHTISYRGFDVAGNEGTTESLSVVVNAAGVIYSGDTSGNYSDSITLEAQLIDLATRFPLAGRTVIFVVGAQTISAVTGTDGFASATIILDQPAGVYQLTATFESDGVYLSASTEVTFVLEKEQATASYTGSTVVSSLLETFELRATVFDDDDGHWGDLTMIYITFTIYSNEMDVESPILVEGPHMVGVTDVDGVGVALIEIANLPAGTYLIVVSFEADHNDYYQGLDSETVTLTIYEPSGDFVTGGGWILDSSGHKGHFGFVVKYKSDGTLTGRFIYIYRDGDWLVIIKSNEWIGLAIVDNHAYFEATVSILQFNFKTFECLWSAENHVIKVDAWDNDCTGEEDVFQMRVYDENGLLWHEAGFNPYGYLEGGNIRIHRREK
ncbi:MAG: Ig-like domain-containing protein [Candidatus Thorarchaeota archaeon]